MGGDAERRVVLGRISGLYGVKGWVKVYSFTEPKENILTYSPWLLGVAGTWREYPVAAGRLQGKGVIAALEGVGDRDQARLLVGSEVAVCRERLPALAPGEYYWRDLLGLQVATVRGVPLGSVDRLMETGGNDVLVVRGERERLIPWLPDRVVVAVDLVAGTLTVDWDPDF